MSPSPQAPGAGWSNRTGLSALVGLIAIMASLSVTWWLEPQAHADDWWIPITWQGPTVNLAWDQTTYAVARGSILGDPVVVPGDRGERTAVVRNGGPSNALVTVQILVAVGTSEDAVNDELESLVHLFWDIDGRAGDLTWEQARLARDRAGVSHTVSFRLGRGEEFPVTAGYYFPASATTGTSSGAPSSRLSFDVRVLMQGDADVTAPTGGASAIRHPWTVMASTMTAAGLVCLLVGRRRADRDCQG